MAVSNPLYKRIQGGNGAGGSAHPTRPRITVDLFLAILMEWATGALTSAQANDLIGSMSGTQDPQTGAPIPVPLDATEQQQANDLWATINGLGQAQQASRQHKVIGVLHLLESSAFA
jgi:hypothetical protein